MKVLIVDDNQQYREAFVRMLSLEGCDVCEAGDLDDALQRLQDDKPDVVVTDLQMRTDREGLDVIDTIKATDPVMPVIMISGVGSFEEGALAMRLGATHVIHKSRIEDELEGFLYAVQMAHETRETSLAQLATIAEVRERGELVEGDAEIEPIKALLADPDADAYVKREAFELISAMSNPELLRESEDTMQAASASGGFEERMAAAEAALRDVIDQYNGLDPEGKKALVTAEYLFDAQQEGAGHDFSRSVAFSYSLAVECEVRARLKGRITRLARGAENRRLLEACMDLRARRVDADFFAAMMRAARRHDVHFTVANVKYILQGLLSDKSSFKANGLKDVGIILLCFARTYSFSRWGQEIRVENPLKVRGFQSDDQVLTLAALLISLQYARNPYVHPDAGKRDHLATLRQTAIDSLNALSILERR